LISDNQTCLESLLLWAQLAAAHWRADAFCIDEHRSSLLRSGEPEDRVDKIGSWRIPGNFTEHERAVIALSEAISEGIEQSQLTTILRNAQELVGAKGIMEVSSAVLAVNQWIDLHGKNPMRVIVVEDNEDDQELLALQLRKTAIGDHVLFLSQPQSALQLLQGPLAQELRKTLLAIILDVHLPQMSGIELLRIIRSDKLWETFPVIMMTGDSSRQNVTACEALNVMAFVAKPLTITSFAGALAPLFHQPATR
jgi:CheY-like chemotaxis protein